MDPDIRDYLRNPLALILAFLCWAVFAGFWVGVAHLAHRVLA